MTVGFNPPDVPSAVQFDARRTLDLRTRAVGQPIERLETSASALVSPNRDEQLRVSSGAPETVALSGGQHGTLEARVFDVLVNLKVSVAEFAMHLSAADRHRIFEQLDSVVNSEDWYEEDELPHVPAFRRFLKWLIHSQFYGWKSFGVSDDGHVLIAWIADRIRFTANFGDDDEVVWTASIKSETGQEHAAGRCSLHYFTKQAHFYLD